MIKYKLLIFLIAISMSSMAQEDAKTIFTKATNQLLTDNMELSLNVRTTDHKGRIKDKSFDILMAKFGSVEKIKIIMQQPERAKGVTIIFTNTPNEIGEIEVFTPANGKTRKMKATPENMALVDFDFSPSNYSPGNLDELNFKMLEKEVFNEYSCYKIAIRKKEENTEKKSEYLIDENTLRIVQISDYDDNGKKISNSIFSDFQAVKDLKNKAQPMTISLENLKDEKQTMVQILKIIPRSDFKESDFDIPKISK